MSAFWEGHAAPFNTSGGFRGCWSPGLGLFVAAGAGTADSLASSPDGETWTGHGDPFGSLLSLDVAWSPSLGLFVAVGGTTEQIATSPDGAVWTPQTSPFSAIIATAVAWSDEQAIFCAGSSFGVTNQIATSPDGLTWTAAASPFDGAGGSGRVNGICYSPALDLWLAVGVDDLGVGMVATSPDAVTWTVQTSPLDGFPTHCCWSPTLNRLLAVGNDSLPSLAVVSSPDGITWTTVPSPFDGGTGYGVVDAEGTVFVVGTVGGTFFGQIASTENGLAWASEISPFAGSTPQGVTYAPGGPRVAFGFPPPYPVATRLLVTSRLRDYDPPLWRTIVTDTDSVTLSLLDHRATNRQLLYTLNAPAYATGLVSSEDPEVNLPYPDPDSPAVLTNNRRLLFAFRYEGGTVPWVCRFGGIVMSLDDESGDSPTSRYTAYDPWQYLMSRPVRGPDLATPGPNGLTFNAGDLVSDIALGILNATQTVDGETHIDTTDTGLLEPCAALTEPLTFEQGLSVGEAWNRLTETGLIDIELVPFYDPISAPGKVCKLKFAPAIGTVQHDAVMAWDKPGRSIQNVSRLIDGTRLLNRARFFAGQGGQPVPDQTDATSIAAYGEYWAQQFFPDSLNNRDLVAALALAEVQIRRNGARSISFDPAPERSPLALRDYRLGDYLPVWASDALREPIGVDYAEPDPSAAGYQRVYAIPVELDDEGTERVRGIMTSRDTASA